VPFFPTVDNNISTSTTNANILPESDVEVNFDKWNKLPFVATQLQQGEAFSEITIF
jgi:hypothetical protein